MQATHNINVSGAERNANAHTNYANANATQTQKEMHARAKQTTNKPCPTTNANKKADKNDIITQRRPILRGVLELLAQAAARARS